MIFRDNFLKKIVTLTIRRLYPKKGGVHGILAACKTHGLTYSTRDPADVYVMLSQYSL